MHIARRSLMSGLAATAVAGGLEVAAAESAHAAPPLLRRGSRGAAVLDLQKRLTALGYWNGTPDGIFGHLTEQAVWALQKTAGLRRDGAVGSATWTKLHAKVRPAHRMKSGTWIEVNKSRQLLLVVVGGRLRYVLNTSTGSGKRYRSRGAWHTAYTPVGRFSIYWRYTTGWRIAPLGRLWRPAFFRGGYAIHGSGTIPPYPASHGCCRLSTQGMDMLYAKSLVPVGRRVYVY